MDVNGEAPQSGSPGQVWLDALPPGMARAAADALARLPTAAAAAGDALPEVVAAWTLAAPETAARLLEAWLASVDDAGQLHPPCPIACQWAERIAAVLPDRQSFVARVLPALARLAERQFDGYDAAGTGLPQWPAPAAALFPGEFAPGRFTVDLAVLLANEAAAFGRLAAGQTGFDRALDEAEGERRELDGWLADDLWDEESSAFHRRDAGRASVPDDSPCGLFPLVWEGRTDAMVEGLRPRAATANYAAWPLRARALFFALLLRTPHKSVVARLRQTPLPATAAPAEQAAWTVLTLGAEALRAPHVHGMPRLARWVDAHGRGLARGLAAAALALVVALLGWWILQREKPLAIGTGELERQARQACAEGKHDRAAARYRQAARRGDATYFRYRLAGEWMHLGHAAEAEAAYRAMLAEAPDTPNARMNLALAVLRQGRRAEARELYAALAEEPGAAAHPELAARARLAVELLDRQLALDRE